jgi:hypothetical protein
MSDPHLYAAWSRVFSPLVDTPLRREAWQQLGVDGDFAALDPQVWKTFHVALPAPPVPLLLHAALARDGGAVREEFVRIMEWLQLDLGERPLPPDHLACALELLAVAIQDDEPVLAEGLRERYLIPWCEQAVVALKDTPAMLAVVDLLHGDLFD